MKGSRFCFLCHLNHSEGTEDELLLVGNRDVSVYFHTTDLNGLDEKFKGFQGKQSELSVCIWEKNL